MLKNKLVLLAVLSGVFAKSNCSSFDKQYLSNLNQFSIMDAVNKKAKTEQYRLSNLNDSMMDLVSLKSKGSYAKEYWLSNLNDSAIIDLMTAVKKEQIITKFYALLSVSSSSSQEFTKVQMAKAKAALKECLYSCIDRTYRIVEPVSLKILSKFGLIDRYQIDEFSAGVISQRLGLSDAVAKEAIYKFINS